MTNCSCRCRGFSIDSADHDILYDIFVSPADPAGYREALDDIRHAIGRIRDSGISGEELARVISGQESGRVPALEGIVTLHDLVPLLGVGFSPEQEDQIGIPAIGGRKRWIPATQVILKGRLQGPSIHLLLRTFSRLK